MTTEKGKTIKKWTSNDDYRSNYDQIFGKNKFWCDHCGSGTDENPPEHTQDCAREKKP